MLSSLIIIEVSFEDPKVGEFFSFTLYDETGYLMDGNTAINSYNMAANADGSFTVSFNFGESTISNITSIGREFNYIVIYAGHPPQK